MLVRVLEIPRPTGNFHFRRPERMVFAETDWFRDEAGLMRTEEGRKQIEAYIRQKSYYASEKAYLVLAQEGTFTINYSAP